MKKLIVSLIIFSLLFVSVYAATDPNKWDGFRGIKWGTNIKDINDPNMILVGDFNELKFYTRENDKLSIGDAQLESICYLFCKDLFYLVSIEAKGETNFIALKDAIFAYYGEGKQKNKVYKRWVWEAKFGNSSKDVEMSLEYNKSNEQTILGMLYMGEYTKHK